MFKIEDVCAELNIRKNGNAWVDLITGLRIICDEWVKQYIGHYEDGSKVKMLLVESKNGFVRLKRFEDEFFGVWMWSFKSFPKNDHQEWTSKQLEKHCTYPVFGFRLTYMIKRRPPDFRADVYFEDM